MWLPSASLLERQVLHAGLMQGKTVMANPGRRVLLGSEQGIVVGTSQEAVTAAMRVVYSIPPLLEEAAAIAEDAKTRLEVRHLTFQSMNRSTDPLVHRSIDRSIDRSINQSINLYQIHCWHNGSEQGGQPVKA